MMSTTAQFSSSPPPRASASQRSRTVLFITFVDVANSHKSGHTGHQPRSAMMPHPLRLGLAALLCASGLVTALDNGVAVCGFPHTVIHHLPYGASYCVVTE
jgi:hypothetical protein